MFNSKKRIVNTLNKYAELLLKVYLQTFIFQIGRIEKHRKFEMETLGLFNCK